MTAVAKSPLHAPEWWTPERRAAQGRKTAAGWHRRSRLTWADIRKIRAAHQRGEPTTKIAAAYAMSEMNIVRIVRNVIWVDPEYRPGFDRVCALPGCDVEFHTMRTDQRFCAKACRLKHRSRVARGYYSRRLRRCILVRSTATPPERARCACVGCVEVLMARAARPIEQVARRYAPAVDMDDAMQLGREAVLGKLDTFPGSGVRWEPWCDRLALSAIGAEYARLRAMKRGGRVVTLRLDQPLGDGDDGETLGAVVAAPGRDPLDELAHRHIAAVLGDVTLEDVEKLTDLGLARLRERLRREGVTPELLAA